LGTQAQKFKRSLRPVFRPCSLQRMDYESRRCKSARGNGSSSRVIRAIRGSITFLAASPLRSPRLCASLPFSLFPDFSGFMHEPAVV
jgi:hypothetical protein